MVSTIVEGARRLKLPLRTRSGANAWGGHSLRVGGVQHLARCGIDVWRIQALARHSSNAILTYLDGVHSKHLGNIAAEAALGRSLESMRSELKAFSQRVSASAHAPRQLLAPLPDQIPVATTVEEVIPEPTGSQLVPQTPASGGYVRSRGPSGRVHVCRTDDPSRTLCNWHWSLKGRASVHEEPPRGLMCTKCTSAHLRDLSESNSSSSDC